MFGFFTARNNVPIKLGILPFEKIIENRFNKSRGGGGILRRHARL